MSTLKASYIKNPDSGASNIEVEQSGNLTVGGGIKASGIVTATSFSGSGAALTGIAVTAFINAEQVNVVGVVTASSGSFSGNIGAASGTFTGNVSVGGTLTYEDVTNVDSVGLITARTGINVVGGGMTVTGISTFHNNVSISGVVSASTGANLDGYKVEEGDIETTSLNGEFDYKLENGHVQKFTGSTAGNYQPDFKVSSSTSLSSVMDVGDVVTCTLMVASSSHYLAAASIKIDNSASNLDIDNVGGSAPDSANGSGFDIYTFTIQKTAATPAYHIVVNTMGAN